MEATYRFEKLVYTSLPPFFFWYRNLKMSEKRYLILSHVKQRLQSWEKQVAFVVYRNHGYKISMTVIENFLVYGDKVWCVEDNALVVAHGINIPDAQPSLGMRLSHISCVVLGMCNK